MRTRSWGLISAVLVVCLIGVGAPGSARADVTPDSPPTLIQFPDGTPFPHSWSFTAGTSGILQWSLGGLPEPTVTITGVVPSGIYTDDLGISGTPAFGTAGVYHLAVTAANRAGTVSEALALTVVQGTLSYPTNGAPGVDTTRPFTWFPVPQAQAYVVTVGQAKRGTDVFNSGVLPKSQLSVGVPAMPYLIDLYATLYVAVNGRWVVNDDTVVFVAERGVAVTTYPGPQFAQPVDQVTDINWWGFDQAQGYIVTFGTKPFGDDRDNSGVLSPALSYYPMPELPTDRTIYATLYSETNGNWSRYHTVSFTAAPGKATFTYPVNGQVHVNPNKAFTWAGIGFESDGYYLIVGTTLYGSDLVNSGVLLGQTSYQVPLLRPLPTGRVLYATLLTKTRGAWNRYQVIGFIVG